MLKNTGFDTQFIIQCTHSATLWLGPIPFDLILKNCPVEVLKEELLVAAVVQIPTADART
jgi:hypothetical protein